VENLGSNFPKVGTGVPKRRSEKVRNESITSLRQGIVDAPLKNHLGGVLLKIVCHLFKKLLKHSQPNAR
jgi:hypothetical protein